MLSIVIPVYFNEDNLFPLYEDIKAKIIDVIDYDYEIVMVDDGSNDASWEKMQKLNSIDPNIKIIHLSRNFGAHAAILCGLSKCKGDCAVVKMADLQEPTTMVLDMYEEWLKGYNVVLAVREGREESRSQTMMSNLYYWLVKKTALPKMPKGGFDTFLIDRKVIDVLVNMDENDSAITGQILWSGFRTTYVPYVRLAREIGKSKWTFKKKIRLVTDTLFSFSNLPITVVSIVGFFSAFGAAIWAIVVAILRLTGKIVVSGFATLFIFQLFSFGVIMATFGILGGYLWRMFDASRNRPVFIIEDNGPTDKGRQKSE